MFDMILDTETTGLESTDVIIEIAIIRLDNGEPLMNTLVKPTVSISEGAMRVHGITEEMVADAPSWKDLHQQFLDVMSKCDTLHIYNSPFDTKMLIQTAEQNGLKLEHSDFGKSRHCVMRDYAATQQRLWPEHFHGEWQKLIYAAKHAGFEEEGETHRAFHDCKMTRAVHFWIEEKKVYIEQRTKKRLAAYAYRENARLRKMALVPDGTHINRDTTSYRVFDINGNEYQYFKGGAPRHDPSLKTLSSLRMSELDKAKFVGMCTSTYGDEGYVFKITQ